MKVLLLKSVKDLGAQGEIVEVNEGYARNFLFARSLGSPATDGSKAWSERLKKAELRRQEKGEEALKALTSRIASSSCTISRKAGDDGKLFGSVSASDIADALRSQGLEVDRKAVHLSEHIKATGVYTVKVRPGHGHEAPVKVWIVRDEGKGAS